ncbi:MAG: hypothetical protein FRX49_13181 [Trebouxia sp. A1-2]|nr:MAG: hypothetical protein FRX49_13181 [Trebouxia sp. A1-2]
MCPVVNVSRVFLKYGLSHKCLGQVNAAFRGIPVCGTALVLASTGSPAGAQTGLNVEVTYSYKVERPAAGKNPRQIICCLELTGNAPTEAAEYQTAKLVCYQEYHNWREARLQNLVAWFAAQHPGKLDAALLGQMNKSINAAAQVNDQQYMHTNGAPAICFMGHAQLTVMARTLIPEQAEAILEEYADAFNWKEVRVSEVDLVAERTAAGKAGIEGKAQTGNKGGSGSGDGEGSETKDKKGPESEKQGISETEALKQSFTSKGMSLNKAQELQEEGRRKLLDLLIEWGMQRPAQLEQEAYVLQRTSQGLDARFKEPSTLPTGVKPLFKAAFGDDMSSEQHSKNKAHLEGVVELKQQQARFWAENFLRWSQLADQAGSASATFDLGSSMTSEGLLLETAAICTITGPMLPPLLVKMQKPECMDGFSLADPWPLSQINGQSELQPIAESNLLNKLSSLAKRHVKLDHLEEFHCIMPKDMTKPQGTPRISIDPSTAPAASLNIGAATSWPQAAAIQQVNTANQAKSTASQSKPAASHRQSMVDVPSSSRTSAPGQARAADAATASALQQPQQAAQGTHSTQQNNEEEGEAQALSGSVSKSGFEFCGSGDQFKEVVDALERYLCSGERRSMQWIPSHGPVRLQRLVMSARKDGQGAEDYHNLQVSDAFGVKPGDKATAQGPRSCYVPNERLTALTDCMDQYVQQQPAFMRLRPLEPVERPHQPSLVLSMAKVVGRVMAYAALGVVLVAPLVAAFSGVGVRRPGGQAATPKLPGVTQTAEGHVGPLQSAQMEAALIVGKPEAGVPEEPVDTLPKAMHASMSAADMQQLCKKLEAQLKPPPQVRLGLRSPDALLGKGAIYQLVVDSQGEVYGCWPTNRPAVNLWSNLPATAQLRSSSYQKRYQQWVTKVSEVVPGTNKVVDKAPPMPSTTVHKKLPENPVVLRMVIMVDKIGKGTGSETNLDQYTTLIDIMPWTDTDSEGVWNA